MRSNPPNVTTDAALPARASILRLFALALLSAALLSISVRPSGSGYVAWVALLPLLLLLHTERSPWRAALAGALASLGLTLVIFEGTAVAEPWTYPVLVAMLLPWFALLGATYVLVRHRFGHGIGLATFPLLWLAAGVLPSLQWLWGAFANPNVRLGYSQFDTPLLAAAHWSGVSGVELLVVGINVGLFCLLLYRRALPILAVIGLAGIALLLPAFPAPTKEPPLRVAAVQGAVRPIDILLGRLDRQAAQDLLVPYQALTARAQERTPDLIVWGETIVPQPLTPGQPPEYLARALDGAGTVLMGAISLTAGGTYNSAFLWSAGELNEVYRKRALIPLVEDVYGRGAALPPLSVNGVRVGIGICLDSMHPETSRDSVRNGAEALIVLTDDSFAGETATATYHLHASAFRAAETMRPLLFMDQRGASAFISANGRIVSQTERGEAVAQLGELQGWSGATLFVRFGDWLGNLATILSISILIFCLAAALTERRSDRDLITVRSS